MLEKTSTLIMQKDDVLPYKNYTPLRVLFLVYICVVSVTLLACRYIASGGYASSVPL